MSEDEPTDSEPYMPYLFGDNIKSNTAAAKFFHRWLLLQQLGWRREQAFAVLMDDPGLTAPWREFAKTAHDLLLVPDDDRKKPTQKYVSGDQHAALYHMFQLSPLLTPYVREVLMDGNIRESLETLLAAYRFEQTLPDVLP